MFAKVRLHSFDRDEIDRGTLELVCLANNVEALSSSQGHEQSKPGRSAWRVVIGRLGQSLRGWDNHFRTGKVSAEFSQIGNYSWSRVVGLIVRERTATCVPVEQIDGRDPGSTTQVCNTYNKPSDTRRQGNRIQEPADKLNGQDPHVRIIKGVGTERARALRSFLSRTVRPSGWPW